MRRIVKNKRYRWTKDKVDIRDYRYQAKQISSLPKIVDLTKKLPMVYNQGQLGSCTANALAAHFDFERLNQKLSTLMPSRLFIYYNERVIQNTVNYDSGAQLRDGIKTLAKYGTCSEKDWKYDIFRFAMKPNANCYKTALNYRVKKYLRLDNTKLDELKSCLASGYGFVFGFTVYESFESLEVAKTGILKMPKPDEKPLGGHAVFCMGYDDNKKSFIVRNSWGPYWGVNGNFYMPYEYITNPNLCDDFWTIRMG